jgi:hypothetical protein
MYEELLSYEEMGRSLELPEMFVVLPAFRAMYRNIDYSYPGLAGKPVANPYNSSQEPAISQEEIKGFLGTHQLLPDDLNQPEKPAEAGEWGVLTLGGAGH